MTAQARARVGVDPVMGQVFVGPMTPGGVMIGVVPEGAMPDPSYMQPMRETPAFPQGDPAMFGQVRPDRSIIGIEGQ